MAVAVIFVVGFVLAAFFIRAVFIFCSFAFFIASEKLEERKKIRIETVRRAERDRIRREIREKESS